ncbi:MAG: 30S ribosomal protein S9 [Patescibacteria group bacterium]|nr:30S ribosomal protein S9 [Patescibacteria group bacterium]MDE2144641.1 30S ribosomal protein S9 [Patescibacteria group bacterium]
MSKTITKDAKYFEGVGRRKTAVARVRIYPLSGDSSRVIINDKDAEKFFPVFKMRAAALSPLKIFGEKSRPEVSVSVRGGGMSGQADAVTLGLARAIVKFNPDFRPTLKAAGYLSRDERTVERKKYGLRKARRAPQWKKR